MDRTTIKDKQIILGTIELTNLIKALIRGYKFHNNNEPPLAVVIPHIGKVEDVTVIYEVKNESAKPKITK